MTTLTSPETTRLPHHYRRLRVVRARLSLIGFIFAVVFFCASMTPSLMPRSWYLQGAVSGITAAIGYGLGTLLRRFWPRTYPRAARIGWRVMFVVAPLVMLLFLALGTRWQQELRARLGMERMESYDILRIVGVSVLTFALLLLIARSLRLGTRRLARLLGRWVPKPIAYGAGIVVVVYVVSGLIQGFLANQLLALADRTASLTNGKTSVSAIAPISPLRSGSPTSLAPWRTLGMQGREFIGTGPNQQDISQFAGRPAQEPIRLYAGLESAAVGRRSGPADRARDGPDRCVRPCGGRRGHADRNRLGGQRGDGLAGVHVRRRLRPGLHAVLVPAELDLLPGRPFQGRRVVAGADRRGARAVGAAAPGQTGRSCCCSARAWVRSAPSPRFPTPPR